MANMRAARYLAPHRIDAVELRVPTLDEGEALVQVEACGICGSDLTIAAGLHPRARAPLTIGHEFCGRVVEVRGGENAGYKVGDRVTAYPLISCGQCFVCRHGNPHVCRQLRLYGFDVDGGMAEFVKLPLTSLIQIPDSLPMSVGALLEPLAVGVHAVSRVAIQPTDVVVILGAGTIGLVTALAVQCRVVARIFLTDVAPARRELARELGFEALDGNAPGLTRLIQDATESEGADVVFECTGAPPVAPQMTNLVRCRGSIVNVGVFKKPVELDLQAVNFKELALIGSRVYSCEDFRRAVQIAPSLPMEKLITLRFPLKNVSGAFGFLLSGAQVGKVLVEIQ